MSEYDYEHFVKDFISRTKHNLTVLKEYDDKYSMTQLINSLFGLLIIPFERYKYVKNVKFEEYLKNNKSNYHCELMELIKKLRNSHKLYNSYLNEEGDLVFHFLKHLRNSLSHSGHGCLYFLNDKSGVLEGVLFYDYKHDSGTTKQFLAELDFPTIEKLINITSNLYSEIDSEITDEIYTKKIEKKRELFKKF